MYIINRTFVFKNSGWYRKDRYNVVSIKLSTPDGNLLKPKILVKIQPAVAILTDNL
jgi:hypothetical protein